MMSLMLIFLIAGVIMIAAVIAAIIITVTVIRSNNKNQLNVFDSYRTMANNLMVSNKEVREELSELKDKICSIEKMLKEVE